MPRRTSTRILVGVGVVAVGILTLWIVDMVVHRDRVPRNVEVAGIGLGGSDRDEAAALIAGIDDTWAGSPVTINTSAGTLTSTAGELGIVVDIDATLDAAFDASPGNPLAWVGRLLDDTSIEPAVSVDLQALSTAVAQLDLGEAAAVAPSIDLVDGELVLAGGRPGQGIDAAQLATALTTAFDPDGTAVTAELVAVDPPEPSEELAGLVSLVNSTTAEGLDVEVGGRVDHVEAAELRSWLLLDTTVDPPALALADVDVQSWIDSRFGDLNVPGTDAVVIVLFGTPTIVGGDPAITCCGPDSPDRILDAILAGETSVALEPIETPTERNREWAEGLGITEVVGEFTTRHPAGQPRVQNIHRIADLVQGVLIMPGETFSVNDFVGPRTTEGGFVSAPVIQEGVFSEGIGGGISQFATTLFNAAFHAGLEFGEYQSHSIYIDRYPYGREATLSYPSPDLEIINTTPHAILVWPSYTDSSITVQLYSTRYVTGAQTDQTRTPSGTSCTRVVTERTLTFVDGTQQTDSVVALYRPEGVRCNGEPSRPPAPTTTAPVAPTSTAPTATVPPPPPSTPPPDTLPPTTLPPTVPPPTVPSTAGTAPPGP